MFSLSTESSVVSHRTRLAGCAYLLVGSAGNLLAASVLLVALFGNSLARPVIVLSAQFFDDVHLLADGSVIDPLVSFIALAYTFVLGVLALYQTFVARRAYRGDAWQHSIVASLSVLLNPLLVPVGLVALVLFGISRHEFAN